MLLRGIDVYHATHTIPCKASLTSFILPCTRLACAASALSPLQIAFHRDGCSCMKSTHRCGDQSCLSEAVLPASWFANHTRSSKNAFFHFPFGVNVGFHAKRSALNHAQTISRARDQERKLTADIKHMLLGHAWFRTYAFPCGCCQYGIE